MLVLRVVTVIFVAVCLKGIGKSGTRCTATRFADMVPSPEEQVSTASLVVGIPICDNVWLTMHLDLQDLRKHTFVSAHAFCFAGSH